MLKIECFYENPSGTEPVGIRELIVALADAPHESLFSTDLVIILCEYFYMRYFTFILKYALLPWILYFVLVLTYMSLFAIPHPSHISEEEDMIKPIIKGLISCLMIYFLCFEVASLYRDKLDYFTDSFNIIDITSYAMNIYVLTHTWTPESSIKEMAALAVILMWFKAFSWLRIYSETGFYVRLVQETMSDIRMFLILFIFIIFTFADAMMILNDGRFPQLY